MDMTILASVFGTLFGTGVLGKVYERWQAAQENRLQRLETKQDANTRTLAESYAELVAAVDELARVEDGLLRIYFEVTELHGALRLTADEITSLEVDDQALAAQWKILDSEMERVDREVRELETSESVDVRKFRAVKRRLRRSEKRLNHLRVTIDLVKVRTQDVKRKNEVSGQALETILVRTVALFEKGIAAGETLRDKGVDIQIAEGDPIRRSALIAVLESPTPNKAVCGSTEATFAEVKRCQSERIARRNHLMNLLGGLAAPKELGTGRGLLLGSGG